MTTRSQLLDDPVVNHGRKVFPKICSKCDSDSKDSYEYCSNCETVFCGNCSKDHRSTEQYSKHRCLKTEKFSPENTDCLSHDGEKADFWCEECHELVCPICLILEHSEHHTYTAAVQVKQENRASEAEKVKIFIERNRRIYDDIERQVRERRMLLEQRLDEEEKAILSLLKTGFDEMQGALDRGQESANICTLLESWNPVFVKAPDVALIGGLVGLLTNNNPPPGCVEGVYAYTRDVLIGLRHCKQSKVKPKVNEDVFEIMTEKQVPVEDRSELQLKEPTTTKDIKGLLFSYKDLQMKAIYRKMHKDQL